MEIKVAERKKQLNMIRLNAKALYILSDLSEMYSYLNEKVEAGMIDEAESDNIMWEVTNECATVTVGRINLLREMINQLGAERSET